MDEEEQDAFVLRLTIEHLKEFGQWPKLQDLHQRVHQELRLNADVQAAARRLAPQPFVGGGYSYLGETFAPPVRLLAEDEEGYRLLEALTGVIEFAKEKYQSSRGQPEITSKELNDHLNVDEDTARALRELMHIVPFLTTGGSSNDEGWKVTVADEIVHWPDGLTTEGLLAELDRREDERRAQTAALSEAHYQMIEVSRRPSYVEEPQDVSSPALRDPVGVLAEHPVVRSLLLVGGIATAIGAIIGTVVLVARIL